MRWLGERDWALALIIGFVAAVLTAMTGLEYFRKALPFLREDT